MQQFGAITTSSSVLNKPVGTGGFLEPDVIAGNFNIKPGMKIADFGCGAGYFTISLAQRIGSEGKVSALDVQEMALDSVRAKALARGLDNIETIRANLEVLGSSGLSDGSQDIVLLANILFQSDKKLEIVREGHRVLVNGGIMIVIDWKKDTNGLGPPKTRRFEVEEIKKIVESAGLVFDSSFDAGDFHFGLLFKKV